MKPADSKDRDHERPPEQLLSLRVVPGTEFSVELKRGNRWIKGRLDQRDGNLHLEMKGQFGLSVHGHSGAVDLETVLDPDLLGFSGGVTGFRVVISRQSEIEPFLEAQREMDETKRSA